MTSTPSVISPTQPDTTPTPRESLSSPHGWLNNYRFYADQKVLEDTRDFHARSVFLFPDVFPTTFFSQVPDDVLARTEWSETSLYPEPLDPLRIPSPEEKMPLRRKASAEKFDGIPSPAAILGFLHDAFCSPEGEEPRRPIPSAGGLFPVEVFLILHEGASSPDLPAGLHHLLPVSRRLQPLPMKMPEAVFRPTDFGQPAGGILYVLNLPKAVFKYRYRGYRHGLMEAGSLYQQAALAARHHGIGTRSWSGFCDDAVIRGIHLDPADFLPLLIQSFGLTHDPV